MKYTNKPEDLRVKTFRQILRNKDIGKLKTFIASGIALNKKVGCTASTPLHFLAGRKGNESLEMASLLLQGGANVYETDKYNRTPIDIAKKKIMN